MMSDWRDEFYDRLLRAAVSRADKANKEALDWLDEANAVYSAATGETLRPERPPPSPRKDPDSLAIALMDAHSRRTGETRAETLAKWVLKAPSGVRRGNSAVADIKRLADKWKAQAKI